MSSADQNSSAGGQSGSVDVTDLDIPQLQDVRRQLEQELQHLTQSFGQLKAAQTKFKTCVEAIDGIKAKDTPSLIPLTPSLYVPGKLSDPSRVIVDVGTGYYVEKSADAAKKMYTEKIDFVTKNLDQLQETIQKKQDNVRVVGDVMRMKVMQAQQPGQGQSQAARVAA